MVNFKAAVSLLLNNLYIVIYIVIDIIVRIDIVVERDMSISL
jgi:hypothetical protein